MTNTITEKLFDKSISKQTILEMIEDKFKIKIKYGYAKSKTEIISIYKQLENNEKPNCEEVVPYLA